MWNTLPLLEVQMTVSMHLTFPYNLYRKQQIFYAYDDKLLLAAYTTCTKHIMYIFFYYVSKMVHVNP